MPSINDFKGLDKIALWVIGEKSINNTPPSEGPLQAVMNYWSNQSNLAVIFSTILSSLAIALFIGTPGSYKWVALPLLISSIFFMIRAWAFGRCSRIACSIWK